MPRLGYSKSRTGCESCKRRRVKCDENRPCNACLRHGVECSLLSAATQGPRMTPQRPKSQTLTKHASRRRQSKAKPVIQIAPSWQPDPFTSTLHDPISEDQNEIGALWTTDLQLMHHWTAVTSLTLPRANEVSRIWQVTVAQLSFQNEPLLHQVLATSAYHLAYLNPTERVAYSLVASKHQNDASQALRHAIKDLSVKNCDASFAAASLVLIGSFASRAVHHYEGPSPNIGDMIYIFKLAKGMNQVLYAFQNVIQGGCLGDLFMLAGKPPRSVSMERFCEKLTQLQEFLKTEHIDQTTGAIVDIEAHRFIEGIESAVQTAQVPQLRMTMTWPITMSDEFLWLLGEKDPSALVLMAYYCLLVHETVPYAWYTAGWGDSVVSDIATQVSGPWLEAIQWPLERILNSPS